MNSKYFSSFILTVFFINKFASKKSSSSLISWIMFINISPSLSIVFYLTFGFFYCKENKPRFLLKRQCCRTKKVNTISNILIKYNFPNIESNNSLKLYYDRKIVFQEFIRQIDNAKKSIYISTYVFGNDCVTKKILNHLVCKAIQGVSIKILIDAMGSYDIIFNKKLFKKLREAGGQVCFFQSFKRTISTLQMNFRNHRKIYLFDNKIVFTGGMNLAEEYMGEEPHSNSWEDL